MRWLLAILAVLLAVTLWTAVTQIEPGERAVVRRFGRILDDRPGPGLYVGLPWGIDRIDRVPIGRVRRVVVGSVDPEGDEAGQNGQLLTGDHNLVNVRAELYYTVREADVDKFVVQAERADGMVARAAESALAEWVAGRDVDIVLLRGKAALPPWLVSQVEQRLAAYDLGVQVEEASITHLLPPVEVKEAFQNVARAQTEIRTGIYEAEQAANERLRDAQALTFRIERSSTAYAQEQRLQAQAEAENFEKRLEQYRKLRQENPAYLVGQWWEEISRLYARMRENGRLDLLDHHLAGDGLNITQFPAGRKK